MAKQIPQSYKRFPVALVPIFEPAHDTTAEGHHKWVPGSVDIAVALTYLKGEPFGMQRLTAEEAITYGERLAAAGRRSQAMLRAAGGAEVPPENR